MAKNHPANSRRTNKDKKMELDRPHHEETKILHHPSGTDLESQGEWKVRKTEEHVEEADI